MRLLEILYGNIKNNIRKTVPLMEPTIFHTIYWYEKRNKKRN